MYSDIPPAAMLLAGLVLLVLVCRALARRLSLTVTWSGVDASWQRLLAARLDPSRLAGLPLTLGVLAVLCIAATAGGLVELLLDSGPVAALDTRVNLLLAPFRAGWMVGAFAWLTGIGSTAALLAASTVATVVLAALARGRCILPLWLVVLGAEATTWIGKYAIDRPRPDFLTGVTALSPSFPSAHAAGATAVYGFIAYLLARELPGGRIRFEIGYWAAVLIFLIAFSRLFLSVHYASDVLAGLLVGGVWLLAGIAVAARRCREEAAAG